MRDPHDRIVVGCDFGLSNSGIVILNNNNEIYTQALIQAKTRGAQRLIDIEKGFDSLISPYREDRPTVFVEGYAYGAKYQRESLAELGGVMRRFFCLNEINYWVIPPTTLKEFVTGTGRASKNYMKKCTKELWGISFKSDDVCDAHGLARLGNAVLDKEISPDLLPHQREIVIDVVTNADHYMNSNTARKIPRKKITHGRQTALEG